MKRLKHCYSMVLITIVGFISFEATAASIPIDLNSFTGDPEVTITFDGITAEFVESEFSTVVLLTNDPFLGDPFVIVPGPSTLLTFDFAFNEAIGDDDSFSAYLFLAQDGPIDGVLDQFSANSTQTGMVSFNLDPYHVPSTGEALELGLQFELFDSSGGSLDSTASVSNLTLTQVPIPAAAWLFASGLLGLTGISRRMRSA